MMKYALANILKGRNFFIILSTFLFVLTFSALPIVKAQETTPPSSINIEVSPLFFELTGVPGDKISKEIRVFNGSETDTQDYTLSLQPFKGTETGQAYIVDSEDPAYSLKDWVTFSVKDFTLKPKEAKTFSYTINIPKNAEPGGRYGSVIVSTTVKNLNPDEGTGASTVQKVGSLVLLTIPGKITYRASIKDFFTDKKVYLQMPVGMKLRIHNDSTVHIKPTGIISISNMFGKETGTVDVPPRITLPGNDRFFEMSYDKKDNQFLWPGVYKALLGVNYGEGTGADSMTRTISFVYLPWWFIISLIALIVIIFLAITKRKNIALAYKVLSGKIK
jgi:hypothetical protein